MHVPMAKIDRDEMFVAMAMIRRVEVAIVANGER